VGARGAPVQVRLRHRLQLLHHLRGEGEKLSGGGKSSGLMSFLKIGDRAAGAIKSGGTTRRAAKMVVVDIDHPDIETTSTGRSRKSRRSRPSSPAPRSSEAPERHHEGLRQLRGRNDDCFDPARTLALKREIKAAKKAMVPENYIKRVIQFARQGYTEIEFKTYDTDWDSEAYLTVSGQNSNNSVASPTTSCGGRGRRRLGPDQPHRRQGRQDGQGRDLWEKIGHAAWACADPGIQFNTTMNDWHTCPAAGPIRASNPCSEYMFLDDTACNLASLNLQTFDKDTAQVRHRSYEHAVRLWTIVLEISVMMAQFPSKEIAELSYEYRTLGLGYANIGGLLMTSGIPYDSDEGRAICGALTAIMTGVAYATSAEMAGELGPFPATSRKRENMLRVIRNHRRAAHGEDDRLRGLSVNPVPLDHEDCPDRT
jgi:ribonucleoside-diphosphate reductase alpha chain